MSVFFSVGTRSLQHGIVLAGADFDVAGDHPTSVLDRIG
jgi:hypothetical protein